MTSATLVPLETYLHTDYQPDREYVDGEVKERNFGEKDRMGYVCRSGSFREWQPACTLTASGTAITLDLTQLPE